MIQIKELTKEQEEQMAPWADKWIEIGLRTGAEDRELFEEGVRECYEVAKIDWHGNIVWVDSPFVGAVAAPLSAYVIQHMKKTGERDVDAVLGGLSEGEVKKLVDSNWAKYFAGQFWANGYWGGGAYTSFFLDVCGLKLDKNLEKAAKAYEKTIKSACWWWPYRDFVIVSKRPVEIHRELVDPAVERGLGSHRLHNDSGAAVLWPNGDGVWSIHGVRVSRKVVEEPGALTIEEIEGERNAEVKRVMMERFGFENYLKKSGSERVHEDDYGQLYRKGVSGDEDLVMVKVLNSTPEPDGTFKDYWLRVPPETKTAREGVAWTFDLPEEEYEPEVET